MKIMQKLLLLVILNLLPPIIVMAQKPSIANVIEVQADKKVKYQFPAEFKQAVTYYIKRADNFHPTTRDIDENSAYKKELRYLLKNYGKFSVTTLLLRVRSAHETMVKQETNIEDDVYQGYEKICSALLLVCAQVFFNETRSSILEALHEVDNLLVYWRYQRNHPSHYFFSKSPLKWVMGKEQAKEVAYNIARLERKQKELYTLLGSLIGHAHAFTTLDGSLQTCYGWIHQLLEKVKCSPDTLYDPTDVSSFDECASQLENKLKRVKNFKSECLSSLVGAQKPNHFVRNWVRYATLCAATAYMLRYHSQNPEVMNSAFNAVQDEVSKFLILLLHPLQKVYERGKLIFAEDKKEDKPKEQIQDDESSNAVDLKTQWMDVLGKVKVDKKSDMSTQEVQLQVMQDMVKNADSKTKGRIEKSLKIIETTLANKSGSSEKEIVDYQTALDEIETFVLDTQLVELINKAIQLGQGADTAISEQLAKSITSVRQDGLAHIRETIKKVSNPNDGIFWSSKIETFKKRGFNEGALKEALDRIENIVEPIKNEEGMVINKGAVDQYQADIKYIFAYLEDVIGQVSINSDDGRRFMGQLIIGLLSLRADDDFLNVLHKYTIIIDGKIVPLFDVAAQITENLGVQIAGLIKKANVLEKKANVLEAEATQQLKEARQQLKDHELTLMFTSLIPLGIITFGTSKLYQWSISRDYSPIRIALSEVNSLLIEADNYVDDHYYGKLIYLICKLRHKSDKLKDPMANEFLDDVAKLESKQYSTQTKRAMVENMFNKYAFLGKVAA